MKKIPSPFLLYELSVQSPRWQVEYLPQFHQWLMGKAPTHFREDFCGSAKIACEWVKLSPKNIAVGLDIDPAALSYARSVNRAELSPEERSRVSFLKQDVLKPTKEKFDFIGTFNFSHYIFEERATMLQYARAAHASLKTKGTLFLEMMGGEGFLKTSHKSKLITVPNYGRVKQVWEQHQHDPIAGMNDYSIHFKLPNGEWMNDAFTYHWRIWGIREMRELLQEAGFKETLVLWEHPDNDSELLVSENAEHLSSWNAYVVGVKK